MKILENHPKLKTGKFSVTFTEKTAQKQWEKLAAILNELPEAHKVLSLWRKVCINYFYHYADR
jgi:hypothetical protein